MIFPLPAEGKGLTCIDVKLHTDKTDYDWEFGQCYGSIAKLWLRHANKYTEKCCLTNDNHVLSCKNNQNGGWIDGFVRIGGHKFCDDIIGDNKFILVNVPGTYSSTHA